MASNSATQPRPEPTVPCSHCGLPAPVPVDANAEGDGAASEELAFCCAGCRGAYELIHGWGLDDYYALRDRLSPGGTEAVINASRYDLLDDPDWLGRSAPRSAGDRLLSCRLAVSGLHCGACVWLIERSARLLPGWESARVRMNDHTLDVVFDPARIQLSRIGKTLDRLGYRIAPLADSDAAQRAASENRALLAQIAVAGFCAANSMWIAVALYAGGFSGIEEQYARVLRWAGVLLGLVAVAGPGRTFFRGALAALRTWTPHMDLPVALGLGVGALAGLVGAVRGTGEVYFDSIAVLVFFLLLGRWVQFRQQRRAAEAVALLMRLSPPTATLVAADGNVRMVPTDALRAGDRVRVAAGEGVPADGQVCQGTSSVDRSLLTGESRPVAIGPGDRVEAGIANLEGSIDITVQAVGGESRVGRLMQLVEEAAASKPPVVQLADRIGGWFVVTVIVLAVVTAVAWWGTSPSMAAEHAVALLIVACPCALALATPLALAVTLGRAARRRILVRGGDALERLAHPGRVWFDKTGTLTRGQLQVARVVAEDPREVIRMAAAAERDARHPVAAAIRQQAQVWELKPTDATSIQHTVGGGVQAVVDGRSVVVGTADFLKRAGIQNAECDSPALVDGDQPCDTVGDQLRGTVGVAVDGRWTGSIEVTDQVRDDAVEVVAELERRGWEVGILSGDHPETVAQVARSIGIPCARALGGQTPEDKLRQIESDKRDGGTVVMVGDGVNDAAALAAADVGVALRGGAEASLQAAPVYLATGRLGTLVDLIFASQRTVAVIRRNFAASLAYNVIAVALAMAGRINPLVAAVLMPISSLTVLSLTLASPTFPARREDP